MRKKWIIISLLGISLLMSSCGKAVPSAGTEQKSSSDTTVDDGKEKLSSETPDGTGTSEPGKGSGTENKEVDIKNGTKSMKDKENKVKQPQVEFSEEEVEAAKNALTEYLKSREGSASEINYDKSVDQMQKDGFLEYGLGKDSGLTADNVMVLVGNATYKNKSGEREAHVFYMGRSDKDSPWEVKDMSY